MSNTTTPCNPNIESFEFAEVERIADQQGLTRDEYEKQIVTYMNKFFAIVKGTTATYIEKVVRSRIRTPTTFELRPRQPEPEVEYIYRNKHGFREAMANKTIVLRTTQIVQVRNRTRTIQEEETINLFELWVKSRYRCEFDRLAFTEHHEAKSFNIFHGLCIDQAELDKYSVDDTEPWLEHIHNIWCRGNDEVFDYVIKRLALLVQRPFYKSKVALVLTSQQGAGKGIALAPIQAIFGRYFKVLKPETVFGPFNDSISDCLVLFLDECTLSGSKKQAAYLKTLITEEKHQINAKYLPTVMLDNFITLIISTNDQWAAPVEESDRRYLVLELDNRYAGKTTQDIHEYFRKVREVPYQAVYKLLMSIDLTGFIPTIYPITEATRQQKLYTMDSVTAWIHQSLGEGSQWTTLPTITQQQLYQDYETHVKSRGGEYGRKEPFSKFIARLGRVTGVEREAGTRTTLTIPPAANMKQTLCKYLNDADFPI